MSESAEAVETINFETLPCKGANPKIIFEENIFMFKSKTVSKKGLVKYYECTANKKTSCSARGKVETSGAKQSFVLVEGKSTHNHVSSGEVVDLNKLKAELVKRAASELGKNLRDIFDDETTKNL
jgi:FLYWCH zinc finger domain